MVLIQISIGGITRLTGSGLSIAKWDIVTGTIPPLNETQWNKAFDLYKQTPQYKKINDGMILSEFKFIFFWEYFHRLWARSLGFVFIIPFFIFYRKKMIPPYLMRQLGIIVLLGALVGAFGWIMVASGLVNRPWVNAYKLTLHLGLALVVWGYLFHVYLNTRKQIISTTQNVDKYKKAGKWILVFVAVQLLLGGLMSGMKAGIYFPTWPKMNGQWVSEYLLDSNNWKLIHLIDYDSYPFAPALVQFLHRNIAYTIAVIIFLVSISLFRRNIHPAVNKVSALFLFIVSLQVVLGIITIINCNGRIPVLLGVLHQMTGIFLLGASIYFIYIFNSVRPSKV